MIDYKGDTKLELMTYPPAVAKGPNYGLIHNDEPFDGGVTISRILSSSCIIAYVPRGHYTNMLDAVSRGMAANPIDLTPPYGIETM